MRRATRSTASLGALSRFGSVARRRRRRRQLQYRRWKPQGKEMVARVCCDAAGVEAAVPGHVVDCGGERVAGHWNQGVMPSAPVVEDA